METPTPESAVPSSSATGVPCSSLMAVEDEVAEMTLTVKWSGKEYTVRVCGDDSVAELKRRICELTNVLPKRQKLLYPRIANKFADDSLILSQFNLKPSIKMTMIGKLQDRRGRTDIRKFKQIPLKQKRKRDRVHNVTKKQVESTVEDDIFIDQLDSPEIVDDFELGQDEVVDVKDKNVNKQKLQRRITQYKIKLRNPCRDGKKLLVLDIDYTLFDHRSPAENPLELMRPYLHEFMSAVYAEYDIIVWSATSMKWVELKMGQLGVLNNPNYKIAALLDHLAMITVQTDSHGTFDCKPLGLIWANFPRFYSSTNTIMFDDLRRNFVMNPQNGLIIRPFRKAHLNRNTDQELAKLTQYLLAIAELSDFSSLNHRNWESYTEDSSKRRRQS